MFEHILAQIQNQVRMLAYIVTVHADEEMDNDGLDIFDVEHIILTGYIIERQEDRSSGEWKYLIHGRTEDEISATVVVKLSPTNMVVIITVYAE